MWVGEVMWVSPDVFFAKDNRTTSALADEWGVVVMYCAPGPSTGVEGWPRLGHSHAMHAPRDGI